MELLNKSVSYKKDQPGENLLPDNNSNRLCPETAFREFSIEMYDLDNCRDWILRKLHPDGAYCPNCHRLLTGSRAYISFWLGRRTWCKFCGKRFSATTDTILSNCGLDFRKVWLLVFWSELGIEGKRIAALLEMHPDTVKTWQGKLK